MGRKNVEECTGRFAGVYCDSKRAGWGAGSLRRRYFVEIDAVEGLQRPCIASYGV